MNKAIQILINMGLYGFLVWLLYSHTITEWDPWNAFVIGFVLFLSIVINIMPGLHASAVSPGEYPYDD